MKEAIAIEALREVKEVFDKHGIEFWLDCGTLLGAVRDGKFIPWDSDIDLGTWGEEVHKIACACKELQDMGFVIGYLFTKYTGFGPSAIPYQIRIRKKYGVDLFLYSLNGNVAAITWFIIRQPIGYFQWILKVQDYNKIEQATCITKGLVKVSHVLPYSLREWIIKHTEFISLKIGWYRGILVVIPSHYFKNLSTIEFYGMEFRVPTKTEEYLAYRYGKDWKVPKKDYTFCEDDGAIYQQ